jgi:hypothetical protein
LPQLNVWGKCIECRWSFFPFHNTELKNFLDISVFWHLTQNLTAPVLTENSNSGGDYDRRAYR